MSSTPNEPSNAPQITDRDAKPATAKGAAAVESKLKDAQASLMEAEGKLMASSSASSAYPGAPGEPRAISANDTRETRVRAARVDTMPAAREEAPPAKASPEPRRGPEVPPTERLPENVAGVLCYLFGWVSGLVFLLVDRRPFVRFHAAQSVAVFATLSIVLLVLGGFFLGAIVTTPHSGAVLLILRHVVELVWLVAAVVLMLKAAAGERTHVAIASQYAERAAHGAK